MPIYGSCKTCGGPTVDYSCARCEGKYTGRAKTILQKLAKFHPIAVDNFGGTYCFFCNGENGKHRKSCVWVEARQLIKEIT